MRPKINRRKQFNLKALRHDFKGFRKRMPGEVGYLSKAGKQKFKDLFLKKICRNAPELYWSFIEYKKKAEKYLKLPHSKEKIKKLRELEARALTFVRKKVMKRKKLKTVEAADKSILKQINKTLEERKALVKELHEFRFGGKIDEKNFEPAHEAVDLYHICITRLAGHRGFSETLKEEIEKQKK